MQSSQEARICVVTGFEAREVKERQIAEIPDVGVGLIDDHGQRDHDRAVAFEQRLHFAELLAGAEYVVDQDDLLARKRLDELAEAPAGRWSVDGFGRSAQ